MTYLASLPIPADWILQGSPWGLLALGFYLLMTGRLVPRRSVEDVLRERDEWRDVALRAMGHTDALIPAARIATRVTEALGEAAADHAARNGET